MIYQHDETNLGWSECEHARQNDEYIRQHDKLTVVMWVRPSQ
jgi:hypothetical protein